MKKSVRRGFTLPEILVTVTVVAVLAAVVVPAVTQYVNKGDTPATQQDIEQVRNAITGYIADSRQYPASLYNLSIANAVTGAKGPYLAASIQNSTATGFYASNGLGIEIGATDGALNAGTAPYPNWIWATFAFTKASPTCGDLLALDKALDGGSGTTATASTDKASGMVVWGGTQCDNAASSTTLTGSTTDMALRLVSIGS
jgi:prepilin-type N-terminal cleavage/methylation domain-containing protein